MANAIDMKRLVASRASWRVRARAPVALAALAAAGAAVSCGGTASTPPADGTSATPSPTDTTTSSAPFTLDGGSTTSAASGLPCDVFALLQSHCVACHSSPPIGGAPMALETYADLSAPAHSDPAKTVAQVSLTRIQNTATPMPPAGQPRLSSQEIAAFQSWVGGGAVSGTCGAASGDAGTVPSPYDTPAQCSSGLTSNVNEGSRMRPGDTCVSCHAQSGGEAPRFSLGGTVYPTAHEPTLCESVSAAGASVVITDANNQTLTLTVNGVGNFYSSASIATPFHAKVVFNGAERAMVAAQTSGDCDACHTESGANGAPGRILLP